jgi:hypothetical protein
MKENGRALAVFQTVPATESVTSAESDKEASCENNSFE